jgi:hypothetical protein
MTATLFQALVAVVAVLVARQLRRAGWSTPAVLGFLVLYLAIPALLVRAGVLDRYDPLPAPALLVVLVLTLTTVGITLGPPGARIAASAALGWVVAFQAFRIVVEWILHRLYVEGVVPVQMTYAGRNFDIVTGITGLALGVWLLSGRAAPRGVVLAWNLLGLGLLINIVTIAVLSTPVSFRAFSEGPANLLPSTLPWVWLPSLLVQTALGSHLLVLRMLRRQPDGMTAP